MENQSKESLKKYLKGNSKEESFFKPELVDKSCKHPIKTRFQVLLDRYGKIQQNVADALGFDKAYISRIFNGVEIPPNHVRIKIASYFEVDTSTIWKFEDLKLRQEKEK